MYSDMTIFALLTGVIIPLIVALLTKINASPTVKAIVNLGLSALSGLLVTVNQTNFQWKSFAVNFAFTWVVSIATYYGLWKPTGTSETVAKVAPEVGLG
jgi:small basic protein